MRLAEVLQIVGALLILCPYLLVQFGRLSSQAVSYMSLNALGAGILAGLAAASHLWGFLLLEAVWSMAGIYALVQRVTHHARY